MMLSLTSVVIDEPPQAPAVEESPKGKKAPRVKKERAPRQPRLPNNEARENIGAYGGFVVSILLVLAVFVGAALGPAFLPLAIGGAFLLGGSLIPIALLL